jgi:hypothetical protein
MPPRYHRQPNVRAPAPRGTERANRYRDSQQRRRDEQEQRRARYRERNQPPPPPQLPRVHDATDDDFRVDSSGALRDAVRTFRFAPTHVFYYLQNYFDRLQPFVEASIRTQFAQRGTGLKVSLEITTALYQLSSISGDATADRSVDFLSDTYTIETEREISGTYRTACQDITDRIAEFVSGGSDWVLRYVQDAVLRTSEFSRHNQIDGHGIRFLPRGAAHLELPGWIKNKQACVNVENTDDKCFLYALAAAYMHKEQGNEYLKVKHKERPRQYDPYFRYFNTENVTFPFCISDNEGACNVKAFERANKSLNLNLKILVADPDDKHFTIAYDSHNEEPGHWDVILLLFGTPGYTSTHYAYVHRHNALLSRQSLSGNHNTQYHCMNCLHGFWSEASLKKHIDNFRCASNPQCKQVYTWGDKAYYTFNRHSACMKSEWIVYADFECILVKNTDESSRRVQEHVPCGFTSVLICSFNPALSVYSLPYRASGPNEDVGGKFIDRLSEYNRYMLDNDKKYPIVMTDESEEKFQSTKSCYVCGGPFENFKIRSWKSDSVEADIRKVRDHNHRQPSDNYRGACHSWCNLQLKGAYRKKSNNMDTSVYDEVDDEEGDDLDDTEKFSYLQRNNRVPVVFHNLKGYDVHIIVKSLNDRLIKNKDIFCIPQPGEKFLSVGFNGYQFIDSNAFLQSSLDKLTSLLTKDGTNLDTLIHTRRAFDDQMSNHFQFMPTDDLFKLIARKGTYPYDYMDSFAKFLETKLPEQKEFKSLLTDQDLSNEDFAHAQAVFYRFGCEDLGEYHDLYLMLDVLLLADVFENFRNTTFNDIGLDPARFVSLPGLGKEMCLRQSGIIQDEDGLYRPFEVKLFEARNENMHLFCKNAIRGGISLISGRLLTASESRQIVYVDANNLYGWSMSQPLPIGGYRWMTATECAILSNPDYIYGLLDEGDLGYLFEVDLDTPESVHDFLRDYPIAPTRECVSLNDLSPYSKVQQTRKDNHADFKTPKLLCTLRNKEQYTCHYRNLKLYLKLGATIKKVHRILEFKQQAWIKPFIDYHSKKRALASSDFIKNLHKLFCNSVYGKFLQDDTKHQNMEIVTDRERQLTLARDPFYVGYQEINPECLLVERKKKEIKLDKPNIIGACILELSKLRMYDFYYTTMKPVFGDRMRLGMTDTDSLIMSIETTCWQQEIKDAGKLDEFDFSDYPKAHPFYDASNKKVVGKFKDELNSVLPLAFVGLRSKMYSIQMPLVYGCAEEGETWNASSDVKKAKGVKAHVVKKGLTFTDYYKCLTDKDYVMPDCHVRGFASHNQTIYTETISKKTLSAADTKLYICADGIETFPFGYYRINELESS